MREQEKVSEDEITIQSPGTAHIRGFPPPRPSSDPEKGWDAYEWPGSQGTAQTDNDAATATAIWPNMLDDDDDAEAHLFKTLLYLFVANPPFALVMSIYSLLCTLLITFLSPITCLLLKDKPPLPGQIIRALMPAMRFQFRMIDSDYFVSDQETRPPSAKRLLASAALSPGIAGAVSLAAAIAAVFWVYASIIGEPTGIGRGREREGKRAIRWVRDVWERWLVWSLRS